MCLLYFFSMCVDHLTRMVVSNRSSLSLAGSVSVRRHHPTGTLPRAPGLTKTSQEKVTLLFQFWIPTDMYFNTPASSVLSKSSYSFTLSGQKELLSSKLETLMQPPHFSPLLSNTNTNTNTQMDKSANTNCKDRGPPNKWDHSIYFPFSGRRRMPMATSASKMPLSLPAIVSWEYKSRSESKCICSNCRAGCQSKGGEVRGSPG